MAQNDDSKKPNSAEAAFAVFEKAWFSGNRLDPDEFCEQYPACEPELREKINEFLMVVKIFPEEEVQHESFKSKDPSTQESFPKVIFDDFRIIQEIGRGGMGVVYEAEQLSLKRRVALKVLPEHLSFSTDAVMKFRREAEAGGRQSHPGIVAIHAVGEHQGTHYIAQELVEGGYTLGDKLEEHIKKGEQGSGYFRETAELVAEIADALEHAHESGVIHRDIKPSNILLAEEGRPKVTDFGLAKIEDALALSRSGDFAGTPYYMSPEQAMSRRLGIDRRTDIYSLGVTFYEMLTLKLPFEGKTSHEVLKKIMLVDPVAPHRINPRVPTDLSTICLKAMEKKPENRYQTMEEISSDLRRYLSGDVILAKPAGLGKRLWKRVKRNPMVSAVAAVALIALVAFAVVVPWVVAVKEREKKEAADAARMEIERQYDEILRLSDVKQLSDLELEADRLWPSYPEKIGELKNWLDRARDLTVRLPNHEQTLRALEEKALHGGEEEVLKDRDKHLRRPELSELREKREKLAAQNKAMEKSGSDTGRAGDDSSKEKASEEDMEAIEKQLAAVEEQIDELDAEASRNRTWKFEDTETQWQHDTLYGLVSGLRRFMDRQEGLLKNVQDRLTFAATIEKRSIEDYREIWDEAIASIADEVECPRYNGLVIDKMIGFVPIGQDPDSGLWEFAHLQTGDIPVRDTEGKLILDEEMGLIFVLIPGGTFNMGAVKPSADNPIDSPNVDPEAETDESPVHEVMIQPFMLSKYEMTQGQWLRFTGENRSSYKLGWGKGSLLHPVEQVSWEDCVEVLSKLILRLPSESEWEYAARAGTATVFWTGNDKETLKGAVNLADLSCKNNGGSPKWSYEEWLDDGQIVHAPVGIFYPNGYGLHDVHGNVWEWCQDVYGSYDNTPTDGSAFESSDASVRVVRGGGWDKDAQWCRSAYRVRGGSGYRDVNLGLRPAASIQD